MKKYGIFSVAVVVLMSLLVATAASAKPDSSERLIAFSRWDSIWIGGFGSTGNAWQERVINTPSRFAGQPALSPDRKMIAYSATIDISDRVRPTVIMVVELKTGKKWQLTNGQYDNSPCWSPDSRFVVYTQSGQIDKLYLVDASRILKGRQSLPTRVTKLPANVAETNAFWAGDKRGSLLVFEACRRKISKDGYFCSSIMAKAMTGGKWEWIVVEDQNIDAHHPSISAFDGKVVYEGYDSPKDYYSAERLQKAKIFWKWLCEEGIGAPLRYQNLPGLEIHGQSPVWDPREDGVYYNAQASDPFHKLSISYFRFDGATTVSAIGGGYEASVR